MTHPRVQHPRQGVIRYDTLDEVSDDIREVYRLMQPKSHRVFKTVPILTDLTEGEIVLYDDEASTRRIYTKVNGALRYVALT